ncbi:WhiB family transcriptional regulator [Streptomyces sp. WMMC897]|uniref:WhiB family transcriptional regulator n=1 Tax=Streptomyces sp. WMMC897 TaxID=3014782 RepID=UPI0022B64AA9|nr:WhiB family transcriptional regulator [Streptomyces sp. WMMC897]MCZ7413115.1 WhiB family transcriptional regulator [Streptomyces sp. WMMC897]MCZ7415501.1 WhiB family transcriptional regulator [Streptomyces sp. WMMC897]
MIIPRHAPDTVARPHEWARKAACTKPEADPDWWAAPGPSEDGQTAITWCAACPVRRPCLELAIRIEEDASAGHRSGIYGGLTPHDRRQLFELRRRRGEA